MAARIGNVLYWLFGGMGGLLMAVAVYAVLAGSGERTFGVGLFLIAGILLWLIGRACRYILAGQ